MANGMLLIVIVVLTAAGPGIAQPPATADGSLQRRYLAGVVSHYQMSGNNEGWEYTLEATDVVKRDKVGRYYEEIAWSNLVSNARQALTPASLALRQTLSLDDPSHYMKVPDLATAQPLLIGPITDTLTIYSDLLLAIQHHLAQPGQAAYVTRTSANSWADGQRVVLGQDVVDFSLSVEAVDPVQHTETLLIRHLPPPALHVQLPAEWMQESASSTPNNFVQVSRQDDKFLAEVGKETFDVRMIVDTNDGHIRSATMHNPVLITSRICTNRELTQCQPAVKKTTLREISWRLLP